MIVIIIIVITSNSVVHMSFRVIASCSKLRFIQLPTRPLLQMNCYIAQKATHAVVIRIHRPTLSLPLGASRSYFIVC